MNPQELRTLQQPLKEKYRQDPSAAAVTLRARGSLAEGVSCTIDTGRTLARAGLHPATGGTGADLCSGDLLLQALAACAGVTLNAVATALGAGLRGGEVFVEGDLDFRGTLGVDQTAPVGFQAIRLTLKLDAPGADPALLQKVLQLTERYCVVLQTLRAPPPVTVGLA
jgi:uncharacterized OsmC-like protein